jgi:CopG family nickel-responsive transcriptional regulator
MPKTAPKPKVAGDLVRFGVSIPKELIQRFDVWLEEKDLGNRSEAIRHLIRERLTKETWTAGRELQGATLVLVIETKGETQRRIHDARREMGALVLSSLQTRLSDREQVLVLVLRGSGVVLRQHAERMLGLRGVLYGQLVMAGNASVS